MNLTEALALQPVERLRAIVNQRNIIFRLPLKDRGELVAGLAQALGANAHPWEIESRLDRAEMHLLAALAKKPSEILAARQIQDAFPNGMPQDAVKSIVAGLGNKGMLLPLDNGQYYFPRPVARIFASQEDSATLRTCLLRLQVSQLQQLCSQLRCPTEPARKGDLTDRLCRALSDPATVKALVDSLSPLTRKLLDVLLAARGPVTVDRLLQEVPRDRRSDLRYYWCWSAYTYLGASDNEFVQLQRSGLAYAPNGGLGHPAVLLVPDEIRGALEGPVRQTFAQFTLPRVEAAASDTTFHSHKTLLSDLVRTLVFLQQERPEVLKNGGFPKQALKRLSQKLTLAEVSYAGFVLALLFELDLVSVEQDRFLPLEGADTWLSQDMGAQVSDLCLRWINATHWFESSDDSFSLREYGPGALTGLRSTLPTAARMLPCGVTVSSLRDVVEFLRPAVVSALQEQADWAATFGRLVCSLHWLGLIDRSVEPGRAVRPAEPLKAVFGAAIERPRVRTFVVQPNLEIIAPPDLDLVILRQLLQVAEGPAVAGATVVRLSVPSLRTALDCGWTAERILAFLSEHSTTPIPQTVRHAVQDAAAQYGAVQLGPAEVYLKTATPELMQELLALRPLRDSVRPLTDTVALVAMKDQAKVVTALRQAGKLPHVLDAVPRTARRPAYGQVQQPPGFEPDWEHLVHSDGRAGRPSTPAAASETGGAITGQLAHFDFLLAAIESGEDVEIRYRNAKGALSTRVIEPYDADEEHIYAYCHSAKQEMAFKISNIVWARPADPQLCLI